MKKKLLALVAIGIFSPALKAQDSFGQFVYQQSLEAFGKTVFADRCSGCHGKAGDAMGASPLLSIVPRDLTSGTFKLRSTANGEMPTDQDLIKVINQGIPTSSMPSFANIPDAEKQALVAFIKTLSPQWKDRAPPVALTFPSPPSAPFGDGKTFLAWAQRGQKVYAEACQLCHGARGLGDGPSAEGLTDDWEQPIRPTNLTQKTFKSGASAQDIYKILATGLNGTPMAAFADSLGETKTWELVTWILYLRDEKRGVFPQGTIPPLPQTPSNP